MKEIISNIYKERFEVKNLGKTSQIWQGQVIKPKEKFITNYPPEESYQFSVKPVKKESKEE